MKAQIVTLYVFIMTESKKKRLSRDPIIRVTRKVSFLYNPLGFLKSLKVLKF